MDRQCFRSWIWRKVLTRIIAYPFLSDMLPTPLSYHNIPVSSVPCVSILLPSFTFIIPLPGSICPSYPPHLIHPPASTCAPSCTDVYWRSSLFPPTRNVNPLILDRKCQFAPFASTDAAWLAEYFQQSVFWSLYVTRTPMLSAFKLNAKPNSVQLLILSLNAVSKGPHPLRSHSSLLINSSTTHEAPCRRY